MAAFDVDAFAGILYEEESETRTTPIPADDYTSIIDKVQIMMRKRKDTNEEIPVLGVFHKLVDVDEKILKELNREEVIIRQDIWLDLKDGKLAFGPNTNVQLGRLREAVGQNKKGKPWGITLLEGQGPLKITVGIKENDAGDEFNRISAVKLAD